MDYCNLVRDALEDLIDESNIDEVIGDNVVEVTFYDWDAFAAEVISMKEDGKNFKKELANNIDEPVKIILWEDRESIIIKFLDD